MGVVNLHRELLVGGLVAGHSEEPASEDRVLLHDEIAYHAVHSNEAGGAR